MLNSSKFQLGHVAALASVLLLVAACDNAGPPAESQAAVRVNNSEVSIHQVQAVLQRQSRIDAAGTATGAALSGVVEVLVDQELAAQAAKSQGLDKQPDVIQALELSRRETLARAHHDRIADAVRNPSSDEIDRYYDEHPALFAQRRLYLLQEWAVEAGDDQLLKLEEAAARLNGVDALQNTLHRLGLRYTTRQFAQAAEDVPLLLLKPLSTAEVGQPLVFAQPGGARVFTVIHAHLAPVDRRTAADAIASYLVAERKRQRVGEEMTALRKQAKLQYATGFGAAQAAASAPAHAAPVPAQK